MEKNKIVLGLYSVILFTVGLLLLINGINLILDNLPNGETELTSFINFGLHLTVGIYESFIGLVATLFSLRSISFLFNKKNDVLNNNVKNRRSINKPKQLFILIYMISIFTYAIFMMSTIYNAFLNDQTSTLYQLAFYFLGFIAVVLIALILNAVGKALKLSNAKMEVLKEIPLACGGIYSLILNIINPFDKISLVIFVILLVALAARFIYVIVYLIIAKPTIEEIDLTMYKAIDSNDQRFYDRFITGDKNEENYH